MSERRWAQERRPLHTLLSARPEQTEPALPATSEPEASGCEGRYISAGTVP